MLTQLGASIAMATLVGVTFASTPCNAFNFEQNRRRVIDDFLVRYEFWLELKDCSVARMDLDVTNDGRPEIFLSTTESAGNAGQTWIVYSPAQKDLRYLGTVFLHQLGFRFIKETRTLTAYERISAGEGGFVYYGVDDTGIRIVGTSPELEGRPPELEEEFSAILRFREEVDLRVFWTSCKEFREDFEPKWKPAWFNKDQSFAPKTLSGKWVVGD